MFKPEEAVGDVVTRFPGAANVFRAYGVDFCCGGHRSIAEAAKEQGISVNELVVKINEQYAEAKDRAQQDVDWSVQSLNDLVDHIVNEHHAYLHTTLPVMSELVTKILGVHGARHPELATVHRLFHELKTDLEQHLIEEETRIFPRVIAWSHAVANETSRAADPVDLDALVRDLQTLEADHDRTGALLKQLRQVTDGYSVPADGCGTYHYVFQKLEEIEGKTFLHMHLENNVLFPRLRAK
ncbi:iron-sulfur cluster repair di-iron protein [Alicyclobacillus macrosporangiidus]|uniref:Regulator of cell morphogenesis and NO signaling n=1 Tax=Alicyclobacillus macrosporangiidus TaxID=392015 RepID=A0A1I7FGC5_9BACL|nr:iron-sulfur cluster repair di-iron protein [Alicyclobacillus macrosporangiidus]SFU35166.1 regulator of cell morphogenesis and NO signaling [Alicyclobacillus macrosporangiidus]